MVGVSDVVCPGVTLYRVTSCFSVVDEMQLLKLTGHIERRICRYAERHIHVFLHICISSFIPAHAGTIATPQHCQDATQAHPRSRGEHAVAFIRDTTLWGSSPLTQGTRGLRGCLTGGNGLIPAHAGNTVRRRADSQLCRAHPRSRGEHKPVASLIYAAAGSSPLTRGTPHHRNLSHLARRLIPARAGNTISCLRPSVNPPAHPRSRGEHLSARYAAAAFGGSSPLTRGTSNLPADRAAYSWFIPAHAGNIDFRKTFRQALRVHPAHAGNIACSMLVPLLEGVHPRSRGEHTC